MLARHSFIYLAGSSLTAVVGLISVSLFTRLLSSEEYGLYILGLTGAIIAGAVLFNWIKFPLMRMQSEGEHVDVRAMALLSLAGSACVLVAASLLALMVTPLPVWLVIGASLLCMCMAFLELSQEVMRARLDPVQVLRSSILRSLAGLAFGVAAVLAGGGGVGLLLGIAAGFFLTSLLHARAVWGERRSAPDPANRRTFFAIGLPMALISFLYAIYIGLDRLVVGWMLGAAAAGQYGASSELVRQIILFPSMSIAAAMLPLAVRLLATDGEEASRAHLVKSIELLLAIIAPMAAGFAIVSTAFAGIFLGPNFRDAAEMLIPLLSLAAFLTAIEQVYIHASFHLAKKPGLLLLQEISILGTHLALIFPLVALFGIIGAAYSMLASAAVGLVAGSILMRRAFILPVPVRPIVRVAAAVGVMAIVTLTVREAMGETGVPALAAMIVAGAVTYGAAAWLLDICGLQEVMSRFLRRQPKAGLLPLRITKGDEA